MELQFKKSFAKSYQKLSSQEQLKVDQALVGFQEDPHQPHLRNHALKGTMKGQRAISAGFDLRIIYREEGEHAVVHLIKTGTHNQVY
jgi:addiction module RelE/StbE family toxin